MLWQTPFMLDHLGKELYGIWILSSTVLSYMGLFSFGFMNTFVSEFVKTSSEDYVRLASNIFMCLTIMLVISIPFYFLVVYFSDSMFIVSNDAIRKLKLSLLINIVCHIAGFYGSYYLAVLYWVKKGIVAKNIIELGTIIISNIGYYFVLTYMDKRVELLVIVNSAVAILSFLVVKTMIGSLGKVDTLQMKIEFFARNLKQSFHFFLLNMSNVLIFLGDNLLVSILAGVKNLPSYSISFRMSDYSIKVIKKITEAKAPELAHLMKDNKKDKFISLYWKIMAVTAITAILACLFIIFLGDDILKLWLGSTIQFDRSIITVFAIYIFFSVTMHLNWNILQIMAKHKNLSYVVLFESIVNVILSLLFYKIFDGVIGLAYATLISTVSCSWWYSFYKVRKEIMHLV